MTANTTVVHPQPGVDASVPFLLGQIDGKLTAALQQQAAHSDHLEAHEARIARLENAKAWVLGIAAAVAAVISYLPQLKEIVL